MSYDDFAYYVTALHDAFHQVELFPEDDLLPGYSRLYAALVHLMEDTCPDPDGLIRHYITELKFGELAEPELGEPTNLYELYSQLFPS